MQSFDYIAFAGLLESRLTGLTAQVSAKSRDLRNRAVPDDRFIYAKFVSGLSHLVRFWSGNIRVKVAPPRRSGPGPALARRITRHPHGDVQSHSADNPILYAPANWLVNSEPRHPDGWSDPGRHRRGLDDPGLLLLTRAARRGRDVWLGCWHHVSGSYRHAPLSAHQVVENFQPETLMPALGLDDHAHGDQPLVRADALGDDLARGFGVGRAEAAGGFSLAIGSS